MFNGLGKVYSFLIFSIISLMAFVFFTIFMKEIKGLSREESQQVYNNDSQSKSSIEIQKRPVESDSLTPLIQKDQH